MTQLIIRNEEEAFKVYERAINNHLADIDDIIDIRFEGWPNLHMRISGRDFNGSIPTRIMQPILDLQKEIHRTYCLVKYGDENTRRLTNEEREKLEIVVKVGKGSSDFQAQLGDILNQAVMSGINKMEPHQIVILLVSAGLLWTATAAWKHWLAYKAQERQIDSQVELSRVEKEKMELVSQAAKEVPAVIHIQQGADEVKNHSLHRLQPQDKITVPGTSIEIEGTHASEITSTPREQSQEMRIDGEFTILSVDSSSQDGFKVKVQRRLDKRVIPVKIPDGTLTMAQQDVLKNNEWAKRPVILAINAKMLRGEITSATLVSAHEVEQEVATEETEA